MFTISEFGLLYRKYTEFINEIKGRRLIPRILDSLNPYALRSKAYLILIFAGYILLSSQNCFSFEPYGAMKGIVWRIGRELALVQFAEDSREYARQYDEWKKYQKETSEEQKKKDEQVILDKINSFLREKKGISGLLIYIVWYEIEPEDSKYNWRFLDEVIKIVHQNNRDYKIEITPGVRTPDWVFKKGAEKFNTQFGRRGKLTKNVNRIPLPWDSKYLYYYKRILKKISERYGSDKKFYAIGLTGINYKSGEMHLPKGKDDMGKWRSYGDYKKKIFDAYIELIETYADLFPHQYLCLHISEALPGMEEETEKIVEYCVEKFPKQIVLQNCQLHGRNDNTVLFSYQMIMKHSEKIHNGFQTLASFLLRSEDAGTIEMMFLNYVRVRAEYLEVWYDIQFSGWLEKYLKVLNEAETLGYEKYKNKIMEEGKYRNEEKRRKNLEDKGKKKNRKKNKGNSEEYEDNGEE